MPIRRCNHGFNALGLNRLIALIDAGNIASMRTAEKAGLCFERVVDAGGPAQMYSILKPLRLS